MNDDQKVDTIILKLDEISYKPNDADIKELMSSITVNLYIYKEISWSNHNKNIVESN